MAGPRRRMIAPCARGVATRARMNPSSRSTRRSRSAPHIVITGSAADAEEAAQEAFVRAWLALRRFRQGAEFRPWLLAIVANEARNRVRSRRRREGLTERAAGELAWQAPASERRPSSPTGGCARRSPRCRSAIAACSPAATCSISASRRPPPCSASHAAPSSRARRARSIACARPGGRRHDARARSPGARSRLPRGPRPRAARARRRAPGVVAAAPAARRARARARALPARSGDRAGRLARPAPPRARDLRPAQREGRARHAPARVGPATRAAPASSARAISLARARSALGARA